MATYALVVAFVFFSFDAWTLGWGVIPIAITLLIVWRLLTQRGAVVTLSPAGLTDILIITGRGKRAIEDHFDRNFELEFYLEQKGSHELDRKSVV